MTESEDISGAAQLAAAEHMRLRSEFPFLPARVESDFAPRIARVARRGRVAGLFEGARLIAFLGGFAIENFRNAGKGAFCPDWCHGAAWRDAASGAAAPCGRAFDAYRALYRDFAEFWRARGYPLHALGVYASSEEALKAFSLTGFGIIMVDAARPAADIARSLARAPRDAAISLRRALPSDAASLSELNGDLASHIASSPILMPNTEGLSVSGWSEWLRGEDAVAFVAETGGEVLGYIKAEAPQDDVSYSVHGEDTLAIDGLFVKAALRGRGIGAALLGAVAEQAGRSGKGLLSVDCETMNPEAYGFWTGYFAPVSWGLERRT